tara:strand:- start:283 stop:612 length:330 start_codon:yes stop_codon:yes gene_type:complete
MRASRKSLGASSPKKQRASTAFVSQQIVADNEYSLQTELHSAQMTISEQEIEIERLKTTVIALNAKCSIVDDHAVHAENTAEKHNDSEYKRVELHTHIKTVVEKVHVDN